MTDLILIYIAAAILIVLVMVAYTLGKVCGTLDALMDELAAWDDDGGDDDDDEWFASLPPQLPSDRRIPEASHN